MSLFALILILVALFTLVGGQLLLKHAMQPVGRQPARSQFVALLIGGIFLMTISFFLTLGLLQRFDLSYLYPFQGLSTIIISVLAAILLKERLTLRLTFGALLISAGVVLVAMS
jgi:drug/metabolite transporter (DMT)-like permease